MKESNRLISVTPTVSTTAYAANDVVGTRMAVGQFNDPAKLTSVTIIDRSAQAAAGELILFGKSPAASTITDNSAPTLAAADVGEIIARVPVAAADYAAAINGVRVANLGAIGKIIKGQAVTAVFVTSGTPTYAAGALTLKFGIET